MNNRGQQVDSLAVMLVNLMSDFNDRLMTRSVLHYCVIIRANIFLISSMYLLKDFENGMELFSLKQTCTHCELQQ